MFTFMLIVVNRKFAIRKFFYSFQYNIFFLFYLFIYYFFFFFANYMLQINNINYKEYHEKEETYTCPYYVQIST